MVDRAEPVVTSDDGIGAGGEFFTDIAVLITSYHRIPSTEVTTGSSRFTSSDYVQVDSQPTFVHIAPEAETKIIQKSS